MKVTRIINIEMETIFDTEKHKTIGAEEVEQAKEVLQKMFNLDKVDVKVQDFTFEG